MAGADILCGSPSWVTVHSPALAKRARIPRRVESARAPNTAVSPSACLLIPFHSRSGAGAERSFDDIPFEAGGRGQDLLPLSRRHGQIIQSCLRVADENIPVALRDAQTIMRGFHVPRGVMDGTAERRAEKVHQYLALFGQAVLALALPVNAQLRIGQQTREQIVNKRG